jgi:putative MATE family efflux protein
MKKLSALLSFWFYHFSQALKGVERDYTKGSINKAILFLSIPMVFEMVMESLFAVVDVFFVSRISVNAVATVGLTESVLMIIYALAVGFSMAVTAIVARRVGEKKYQLAGDAAFQSIVLSLLMGASLGTVGYLYAEDVLTLMGGDPLLIAEGSGYTRIMYAGNLSIILLFVNNSIFRGAGNAALAMRTLWLANGLNIVLDPLLIFGLGPIPAFGLEGAAIATTIGRSVGVLYQLYHLARGTGIIKLARENIVWRGKTIVEFIKVSAGGIGQFLVESASWIFLVRIISNFGSEALAGYTIAFRVIMFTLLPSMGIANAAATLVGQNLGARSPERAEQSVWQAAKYNAIFLVVVSVVFGLLANPILTLFSPEAAVQSIGKSGLQIICLGYIFFAYGMVVGQAFNGAGDTRTPLYISLVVFWLIQIPLSYFLAIVMQWEANGVFTSIAICHTLYALAAVYLFRKGRWKLAQV